MVRKVVVGSAVTLVLALGLFGGIAQAANPPGTGQPRQSCQLLPSMPPGFGTAGFVHAGTVYAGSQPQNSNNPKSVSQYDVACYQVSSAP